MIRIRSTLDKIITLPKFWYIQWIYLKGVPLSDKIKWIQLSTKTLFKKFD